MPQAHKFSPIAKGLKCGFFLKWFHNQIWNLFFFFKKQVHQVATDQVFETFSHLGHKKSLPALRNAAASGSSSQLESLANVFTQDAKRLQEVSELI